MSVWVVIVAAGRGRRFGAPKQFARLGGRSLVEWSVDAAAAVADGVVLVLPPDDAPDSPGARLARDGVAGVDAVVEGGDSRSASVRAGLAAVPAATSTSRTKKISVRLTAKGCVGTYPNDSADTA